MYISLVNIDFSFKKLAIIFRITGILDSVYRLVFYKFENTMFGKLDMFPSSGERRDTLLGPSD
jgi:hypothetical protein